MKIIYITCSSQEKAEKIATHCLEKQLAGCANILPSTSLYKEGGTIKKEQEVVLMLKTMPNHASLIIDELKELHPDKLPCIMELDAQATEAYRAWTIEQLREL